MNIRRVSSQQSFKGAVIVPCNGVADNWETFPELSQSEKPLITRNYEIHFFPPSKKDAEDALVTKLGNEVYNNKLPYKQEFVRVYKGDEMPTLSECKKIAEDAVKNLFDSLRSPSRGKSFVATVEQKLQYFSRCA